MRRRKQVALELTAHDALAAHLEVELHIDQDDLVSPWQAALSSAVAFTLGALLPLLAILLLPPALKIPLTFVAVIFALAITGTVSAHLGGSRQAARDAASGDRRRAGAGRHYGIGTLLGTTGVV